MLRADYQLNNYARDKFLTDNVHPNYLIISMCVCLNESYFCIIDVAQTQVGIWQVVLQSVGMGDVG